MAARVAAQRLRAPERGRAGHHHHRQAGALGAHRADQVFAAHPRHVEVGHQRPERVAEPPRRVQGLGAVRSEHHLVALGFEQIGERQRDQRLVLGQEDTRSHAHGPSWGAAPRARQEKTSATTRACGPPHVQACIRPSPDRQPESEWKHPVGCSPRRSSVAEPTRSCSSPSPARESCWRGRPKRHKLRPPPAGQKKATPAGRAPPSLGRKRPSKQRRGGRRVAALRQIRPLPMSRNPMPRWSIVVLRARHMGSAEGCEGPSPARGRGRRTLPHLRAASAAALRARRRLRRGPTPNAGTRWAARSAGASAWSRTLQGFASATFGTRPVDRVGHPGEHGAADRPGFLRRPVEAA